MDDHNTTRVNVFEEALNVNRADKPFEGVDSNIDRVIVIFGEFEELVLFRYPWSIIFFSDHYTSWAWFSDFEVSNSEFDMLKIKDI